MRLWKTLILALTVLMTAACEKHITGKDSPDTGHQVVLRVTSFEQIPFSVQSTNSEKVVPTTQSEDTTLPYRPSHSTRSVTNVTEMCSHISFAVFQDGSKIKVINQNASDESFGQVVMSLPEGRYQLVVIAHSGTGSATVTSEDKVTFPDNRVTDAFYYYGDIEVGAEGTSADLTLLRAVAMFRLVMTDALPDALTTMRFYYTGGSSTFSPALGYGNVNSRQSVNMQREEGTTAADGTTTFEVFTFPHEEEDVLKMTVTALDEAGNSLGERVFEEVPVKRNRITQYKGSLFGTATSTDSQFGFVAESQWTDTLFVNF